jgi:hypothetical protein
MAAAEGACQGLHAAASGPIFREREPLQHRYARIADAEIPSRSFSVTFCCATRPAATQRPSRGGVLGAATDLTVATSEPSPTTRVNTVVAAADRRSRR